MHCKLTVTYISDHAPFRFLSIWPAVNWFLDPYFLICEGPTEQQILDAIAWLPALPGEVQPGLISDPIRFQSRSILGGFANRANADATAIALQMVFRLPAAAAASGATPGGPADNNFPIAALWVASTAAGMAVF
jgi:hypothetical protein